MNRKEASKLSHIIRFGLLLAVIWSIYKLTNNLLHINYENNKILFVIEIIIHFGITPFFIYNYKVKNDGYITLKQAVLIGLAIVSIGSVISVSHDYIFDHFIEKDLIIEKIEARRIKIASKNPDFSKDAIDHEIQKLIRDKFDKFQYIIELIWNLSLGLITSLLTGALMQKNRDIYE